jgi:hypothetical protein
MIRERSNSAMIRALGFDPSSTLVAASKEGTIARHNSAMYEMYAAIASSRFPERIYRHPVADHTSQVLNGRKLHLPDQLNLNSCPRNGTGTG